MVSDDTDMLIGHWHSTARKDVVKIALHEKPCYFVLPRLPLWERCLGIFDPSFDLCCCDGNRLYSRRDKEIDDGKHPSLSLFQADLSMMSIVHRFTGGLSSGSEFERAVVVKQKDIRSGR